MYRANEIVLHRNQREIPMGRTSRLSRTVLRLGLGLATLLGPAAAYAQTPAPNPATPLYTSFEGIEKLQEGGLVMIIRHERTEMPSRADDYTKPANECRAQRNLSVAGVVAASENGRLMRAAGIPVSRVISSPMCRATETARYMFGVDYTTDARLMHHDPGEDSSRPLDLAARETAELVSELAPLSGEGNIALISHGGNIFMSTGLRLSEGEVGILRVDENGKATAISQFSGSTLGFYVRMKQQEAANAEVEGK